MTFVLIKTFYFPDRCDSPDNTTREDSNPSNPNKGEIIHTYANDSDTSVEVGQCEIKKLNSENKSETVACSFWKYDTSVFTSTAISEVYHGYRKVTL